MNILRATHLGMCFGVRDAVHLALHQSQPITILGDLVHNETVLLKLRQRGIQTEQDLSRVHTPSVMITAHGVSDRTRQSLQQSGLQVVEATCPLVHFAHRALRELVDQGFHPVVIGKRGHVEVNGLVGDWPEADIILSERDVTALRERPRYGVVAQTTQPVERVRHLIQRLRERFPRSEIRWTDTVCQPTKQRQLAAEDLARRCDAVLVVGGAHSNNTRELVETCRRYCARVHHVRDADDLHVGWLIGTETVGITAGTSTPDDLIEAVETRLRQLADKVEVGPALESMPFTL